MLCKERLEKIFEKCFPTVIEKRLLGTQVQIQHQTIILREDFWAHIRGFSGLSTWPRPKGTWNDVVPKGAGW